MLPVSPEPSGDHAMPSQRAMRLAAIPPATVKSPPATSSPLGSTPSARTTAFTPEPNVDHAPVAGSNATMRFASTLPAAVKAPPNTMTGVSGPAPSGSHSVIASTPGWTPAYGGPGSHCVAHWLRAIPARARVARDNSGQRGREEARESMSGGPLQPAEAAHGGMATARL